MMDATTPMNCGPCPFCGSINTEVVDGTDVDFLTSNKNVVCNDCRASGPSAKTEGAAIAKWMGAKLPQKWHKARPTLRRKTVSFAE